MTDLAFPFESRWMRLAAGRMHYVDEGVGEPVVLVHGTPTWSFEWRHVIAGLSPGYRCIATDHIGFGFSDRPRSGRYTPEWHADNFAWLVQKLRLEPFTLVVHDFGGPIALPFALRNPALVKRIVVINSWMWSLADDLGMAKNARMAGSLLGRFLYRWTNLSLRTLMPSSYADRRKLTPEVHRRYLDRFPDRWSRGAVLWTLAHALLGSSAFYASLWRERAALASKPALVIWGMRDSAFRSHMLARWREALPQARVVEVANAGHWPHEETPQAVVSAMTAFLGETH
jgi:haloalkane dehalogenase